MSRGEVLRGERAVLVKSSVERLAFRCPGCESQHICSVSGASPWGWNGCLDRPTLSPSVLITYNGSDAGKDRGDGKKAPPAVCHSFVTDGRIQFLSDCTHALVGQTVDLPPFHRKDEK
ncbi:MAG: ammonia monooxygenase [Sphingobium sp.]|nr:MAG: ammonia monooxygenase [Sphingobium sp.]